MQTFCREEHLSKFQSNLISFCHLSESRFLGDVNRSQSILASTSMEVEEEVKRMLEEVKELHDSAASFISSSSHQELTLRQKATSVEASLRRLHSTLASDKSLDPKLVEKLEEDLHRARCMLADGDLSSFLPSKPQGRFVRMFLGPVNVRASRKDIQLKVKEEYNSYRDKTALLFLFFPAALMILRSYYWDGCLPAFPVQLYEAWLLFLYAGLAMRENVLRANGSDIRPWWLYHHYCAMGMALVSLTWEIKGQPNCVQKQRGVHLFLQWAMMQGVAMLLQNRYQRQRLYTRIALGKAQRMDVVWGETAGVDGQLWLLCPILFILQGFQAYVGVLLLRAALTGVVAEWQVMVCGILLVVMAVGNFINTVETLMAKSRVKAKMKKSKSRAELNHTS
ncbi:hypothetical protein Bca4012_051231 [Brassica carinata]|uniref:TMPIT-like protein n=3 Tax=Brassica TaxID=3705 RepID=A0A0D3AT66_BRAOL|nr:PREDICTED: transmembrane protein 120 homolog isoform X1 [Brassica oleracea var. oleracea]XP_013685968.1 transmembrane protein 120 homolog [Brassica napus]